MGKESWYVVVEVQIRVRCGGWFDAGPVHAAVEGVSFNIEVRAAPLAPAWLRLSVAVR